MDLALSEVDLGVSELEGIWLLSFCGQKPTPPQGPKQGQIGASAEGPVRRASHQSLQPALLWNLCTVVIWTFSDCTGMVREFSKKKGAGVAILCFPLGPWSQLLWGGVEVYLTLFWSKGSKKKYTDEWSHLKGKQENHCFQVKFLPAPAFAMWLACWSLSACRHWSPGAGEHRLWKEGLPGNRSFVFDGALSMYMSSGSLFVTVRVGREGGICIL